MKARLIAVGERPPAWVADGFAEYRKRLSHWLPLDLIEIEPGVRGKGRDAARATFEEGQRVLAAIPKRRSWSRSMGAGARGVRSNSRSAWKPGAAPGAICVS